MTVNVILVGCGHMGFSMLSGWLRSGPLIAGEVLVIEPAEDLRQRAETLGVIALAGAGQIPDAINPQLIVFAVKPQSIDEVAAPYRRFGRGTTFLSIAAGVPLAAFETLLGETAPIVRCMPNMPASVGKGVTVMTSNARLTGEARNYVERLLSAGGKVVSIEDERLMDAVTAVSGSGPGYLFYFIESLAAAGEELGLSADLAMLLARQTVFGAAFLAADPGNDPADLRRKVASPNGTTEAALAILMENDRLKRLVADAVGAACRRSVELMSPESGRLRQRAASGAGSAISKQKKEDFT